MVNIVNFYYNDSPLAFYKTFDLKFDVTSNKSFTERISAGEPDICRNLKDIFQIHVYPDDCLSVDKIITNKCTDKKDFFPFIIRTSTEKCAWMQEFRRINNLHFVIAINYDRDYLWIIDPMTTLEIQKIPLDLIDDFVLALYAVRLESRKGPSAEELFLQSLTHIKQLSLSNQFEHFIQAVLQCPDISDEYTDIHKSYWSSKLEVNIGYRIAGSRGLYAKFLFLIAETLGISRLYEISVELNDLMNQWVALKNIFYKSFVIRNYEKYKRKIVNQILNIQNKEESILYKLLSI